MLNKQTPMSEIVSISPYYQRSVLINSDHGNSEAISGYVCHDTAQKLLTNMCQQITIGNQKAFTWTGPFGTGKSLLALALASTLGQQSEERAHARQLLQVDQIQHFDTAFPVSSKGWLILPIVGTNASVFQILASELTKKTGLESCNSSELLENLSDISNSGRFDGVLLIVDEMGKFLEASQTAGEDIFFFQELAELAARLSGQFRLIGILHQAFKQYAKTQRLTEKVQNDWAKVQGRFADLPFVTSADEIVQLISNAINLNETIELDKSISDRVTESLKERRPSVSDDLAEKLSSCWPLHPITTLLLGPISKRQFGQNERSIFGFLGSLEPFGFQEFLRSEKATSDQYYSPDKYWDYLKTNVEPAIISSIDSHRWSVANEALERVEAKGEQIHLSLIKSVAIIDLFKNGSGLAADNELLATIYPSLPSKELERALSDLADWKVIIFRKFNNAWSIFEGSDFDLDTAISQELAKANTLDPKTTDEIAHFHPIIAKRHLYQTGTMRWMGISITDQENFEKHIKNFYPDNSEFGQFVLLLGSDKDTLKKEYSKCINIIAEKKAVFAVGTPERSDKIKELLSELFALKKVANRSELDGDAIARKEVNTRIQATRSSLDTELATAASQTEWMSGSNAQVYNQGNLSKLASSFADSLYQSSPKIHSELINRESLSANSVKARRELLYRMLEHEESESLSIEGFPAEKGLYLACLFSTGIHRKQENSESWFLSTPQENELNLLPAWQAALDLIINEKNSVPCSAIFELWSQPPFGIKRGMMPILLWSLILSNKDKLALYKEGYYLPEPKKLDIDVSLQNINKFELKGVELTADRLELLTAVADTLNEYLPMTQTTNTLSVAKGLVRFVFTLPGWVKRTRDVSQKTMKFKASILKANDPHKVLFHELQTIFDSTEPQKIVAQLRDSFSELKGKHNQLVNTLRDLLFTQIRHFEDDLKPLKKRAENIKGTGLPVTNAFINRLIDYDDSPPSLLDLYSVVISKTVDEWNDQDIQHAKNKMAVMARDFRELEAVAYVNNRPTTKEALAIVYGASSKEDFVAQFDASEENQEERTAISGDIIDTLANSNLDPDAQFAVLASALEKLYDMKKDKTHG